MDPQLRLGLISIAITIPLLFGFNFLWRRMHAHLDGSPETSTDEDSTPENIGKAENAEQAQRALDKALARLSSAADDCCVACGHTTDNGRDSFHWRAKPSQPVSVDAKAWSSSTNIQASLQVEGITLTSLHRLCQRCKGREPIIRGALKTVSMIAFLAMFAALGFGLMAIKELFSSSTRSAGFDQILIAIAAMALALATASTAEMRRMPRRVRFMGEAGFRLESVGPT
jgi:hypothetical protein